MIRRDNEFWKNHDAAEQYFIDCGMMPPKEERTEMWILHHIDPTLKDKDPERYGKWLVEDLVPMTQSKHSKLHNSGEQSHFYGEDHSGEKNGFYGKKHSEETKQKLSDNCAMHNEESRNKMAETRRSLKLHWYNNGIENKMAPECPDGYVEGMLYPKKVAHPKAKGRTVWNKGVNGRHWYTNGVTSVQAYSCPEGFVPGRCKCGS